MVHKVHGDAVVVVVMEACLRNKHTVAMVHPPRIWVVEGAVTAVEGVVTAVEGVVTDMEGVVTAVEGVVTDAEHLAEDLHSGS